MMLSRSTAPSRSTHLSALIPPIRLPLFRRIPNALPPFGYDPSNVNDETNPWTPTPNAFAYSTMN